MDQPNIICQHAFGVFPDKIGEIVVLIERDRIEQYRGTFDKLTIELKGGIYPGITGILNGIEISIIYSKGPADIADCIAFLAMSKTKCHTLFSTGSVGGLGSNIGVGDFILVDSAIGNDGYSQFLAKLRDEHPKGFFNNYSYPNGNVIEMIEHAVIKVVQEYKVKSHTGRIFTIPGVSLENSDFLKEIVNSGCIAIDMETAQFYAACTRYNFNSAAIHWVTDLPLTRNFFYRFNNPIEAKSDFDKKYPIWLNMVNLITDILRLYIDNIKTINRNEN